MNDRNEHVSNPLLQPWGDSHGLPPFAQIEAAHFPPAFDAALRCHRAEIAAIATQAATPDFDNTALAFDRSGRLLARIEHLFHTLSASVTTPALQEVQRQMAAPLAAHAIAVHTDAALFARLEHLLSVRSELNLDTEQLRLLERIHLDFVRAGARLAPADRQRYAELMAQLAELNTRFAQNVLADESRYELLLRTDEDLAGLPDFVRDAARQAARERGLDEGLHLITLSRSLVISFLSFSECRPLREQVWRAWVGRGANEGASDNRALAAQILALRQEQASLHGYACYADYALADTMAGKQSAVQTLLTQVWAPAKLACGREREQLLAVMNEIGATHRLEAWDWRFYAEKLRQRRFQIDEAQTKPFFPLASMVQALFDCAQRLFGLSFKRRDDLPVYHPDVQSYEVYGADGALRGLFLHDNFSRLGKRSGAWMNALRWQARALSADGSPTLPIILNTNNFARPAPGEPALLAFDEVRTLFHEFGHGLHGLLSDVRYERLSGTQVLRDFVELPSQILEHWMNEPRLLRQHARHCRTGEPLPDELLERLQAAARFGQGYDTVRYCASAIVDLAAHSTQGITDIVAFEQQTLEQAGLPEAVGLNHRLCHFQHLFSSSSYAAGYYVYLWAEVLDCDAYEAFIEAGDAFDPLTARRLHDCILSVGNSRDPAEAFRAFRGRDPRVEPMLRERGLLDAKPVQAGK